MDFTFWHLVIYVVAFTIGSMVGNLIVRKVFGSDVSNLKKEIEILKDYDVPILQFEVKELKEQMKELLECFDVKVEKKILEAGFRQEPNVYGLCCGFREKDEIQVTKTYKLKRSAIEEGNKIVFGDDGCAIKVNGVTSVRPKTKAKKK